MSRHLDLTTHLAAHLHSNDFPNQPNPTWISPALYHVPMKAPLGPKDVHEWQAVAHTCRLVTQYPHVCRCVDTIPSSPHNHFLQCPFTSHWCRHGRMSLRQRRLVGAKTRLKKIICQKLLMRGWHCVMRNPRAHQVHQVQHLQHLHAHQVQHLQQNNLHLQH
jgi:hypothetical protein